MSFVISSFIKKSSAVIRDINDPNLKSYFININNSNELLQYKGTFDTRYLDGYISIQYNDQEILNEQYWDLVDQLWAYFLNMMEDFLNHKYATVSFPDQPLDMSFTEQGSYVIFKLHDDGKQWMLPKKEFFNALLDGAENFLKPMNAYFPHKHYDVELDQIKKLRERLHVEK